MDEFEKAEMLKQKRIEAEQESRRQRESTGVVLDEAVRRAKEREAAEREAGVNRSAQASSCCQARVLHTAENQHICTACGRFL